MTTKAIDPIIRESDKYKVKYYHVDVFSSEPMNGNGLTVVFPEQELESKTLLKIAREFKQFETIFIFPQNTDGSFPVRIFTVEEELDFAGHPILGAGAVLHSLIDKTASKMNICFLLPKKSVTVQSEYAGSHYLVTMDQGIPQFIQNVPKQYYEPIAISLNILPAQLDQRFPVEVVSTGLPYLQKRGQVSAEEIRQYNDASVAELCVLLNNANPRKRTIAATLIGDKKLTTIIPQLCQSIIREKSLYPRIAMSEADYTNLLIRNLYGKILLFTYPEQQTDYTQYYQSEGKKYG